VPDSSVPEQLQYTVVGGGIAGLVLARRLARAGHRVSVLEASDHLGGTVARHTVGGIPLDAGAESFANRGGTVAALATELGLGADIVTPAEDRAWLQAASGSALPLPATGVLGIPGVPLASDVIAVVGARAAARAQLDYVMPLLWVGETVSLGAFVRRRMGEGVLEKLVAPVVHGVHSVHPDDIPLDRAVPGLRTALAKHGSLAAAVRSMRDAAPAGSAVSGIRGGLHRLVGALAADLQTYGVEVQLGRRVSPGETLPGEVVLAAALEPVAGRRIVLATLVVDAPALDSAPRGTGVLVASGTPTVRARAITHSTAKWAWLREFAGGRHVLRLSYDEEPESLADTARLDAQLLLGVELPAASVVDFARVEWVRPGASRTPEGIVVGETVAGSGLAAIIAHANRVADDLLG
jgi:oxygen-dependent protoporphyrinogen oxidase